jgi:hypothetical protein
VSSLSLFGVVFSFDVSFDSIKHRLSGYIGSVQDRVVMFLLSSELVSFTSQVGDNSEVAFELFVDCFSVCLGEFHDIIVGFLTSSELVSEISPVGFGDFFKGSFNGSFNVFFDGFFDRFIEGVFIEF